MCVYLYIHTYLHAGKREVFFFSVRNIIFCFSESHTSGAARLLDSKPSISVMNFASFYVAPALTPAFFFGPIHHPPYVLTCQIPE